MTFSMGVACGHYMRGIIKADRVPKSQVRDETFTLESVSDVIRHKQIRWFGHVCRKTEHF